VDYKAVRYSLAMRVLAFGTFDGLHPGHRFYLDAALKRGELFIVVALDETVQRIKGRMPRFNQRERKAAVEQAYPSAHVLLGESENYLLPVRRIAPELIVLGYDQELPPGVKNADLLCPTERLEAFEPHKHKSSLKT